MIVLGMKSGDPHALDQSRSKFEAAHKRCDSDPRLYYGFGLVLLEHGQKKAAVDQFLAAARAGESPFLPGWQAAAWVHVNDHEFLDGWSIVDELAGRLARTSGNSSDAQSRAAEWVGRIVGFMSEIEPQPAMLAAVRACR